MSTPAERALVMYPALLLRAEELCGGRSRAEDLVQDAFEACLRKPPRAATDLELLHWMRQVIFNLNALAYRSSEEAYADGQRKLRMWPAESQGGRVRVARRRRAADLLPL